MIVSGGYRRVHQDGVLMLDKHYHMKDSAQKVFFIIPLQPFIIDRDHAKQGQTSLVRGRKG
jgi:hypothetical protein